MGNAMPGASCGPAGTKMCSFGLTHFFRSLDWIRNNALWFRALVLCRSFQWEILCRSKCRPAGTKMRSFWHDTFFSIFGRRLDLHHAFWFFRFQLCAVVSHGKCMPGASSGPGGTKMCSFGMTHIFRSLDGVGLALVQNRFRAF